MNILLDTNILIPLEDTTRILDYSLLSYANFLRNSTIRLYIHSSDLN